MLKQSGLLVILIGAMLTGCDSGVITFPAPEPALVRIANVTQNVPVSRVTIDSTKVVDVPRGDASQFTEVSAGRPVTFTIGSPDKVFRSNLKYTFGGGGRVILFVRGDTTSLVEFRREIQDTLLPSNTPNSVIRFTHMAETVDKAYFLEVWITGGEKLLPEEYEPGISSLNYKSIQPGTYSFEVREGRTSNVIATLQNVTIKSGQSYMLYSYDAEPPLVDRVTLKIF
ncbi:MAG: hypothetical protein NTX15_03035 [Candidatus Kapabacteria bacterium]|nr:hypothetical protein [Candidatus Kapabacteria bacterium]